MSNNDKKLESDNLIFTVYQNFYGYLGGEIVNGRLTLISECYGDDEYPDSEIQYSFSVDDTYKLFSLVTLEEFIVLCAEKGLIGVESFLKVHGIEPRIIPVY